MADTEAPLPQLPAPMTATCNGEETMSGEHTASSMIEGRELTGEVHLADWVVNFLFGANSAEERIRADEQLDWHLYLKKIEDTGSFYRDLEAN